MPELSDSSIKKPKKTDPNPKLYPPPRVNKRLAAAHHKNYLRTGPPREPTPLGKVRPVPRSDANQAFWLNHAAQLHIRPLNLDFSPSEVRRRGRLHDEAAMIQRWRRSVPRGGRFRFVSCHVVSCRCVLNSGSERGGISIDATAHDCAAGGGIWFVVLGLCGLRDGNICDFLCERECEQCQYAVHQGPGGIPARGLLPQLGHRCANRRHRSGRPDRRNRVRPEGSQRARSRAQRRHQHGR